VISSDRSPRAILLFWLPLSAQWVMMALEGPFLAAVIARLVDPTFNLAAYGVAYAFGILVEAPVIMLMSASTALVAGAASYRRLRNFAHALNAFSTALLLLILIPPVFTAVMDTGLALPPEVSELIRGALWILIPWPAAIGYRRFLHGILIRAGRTRLVMYGTVLRLVVMGGTALVLAASSLPGAWVGAAALTAGVVAEAVAARLMAAASIRELLAGGGLSKVEATPADPESLREIGAGSEQVVGLEQTTLAEEESDSSSWGYREIARFYYPLALTSFIGLAVQPLLTFFMGRAPSPVESLAVFPVVHSLTFLFRALGLSFQEAAIALLGRRCEHAAALTRFAVVLAIASSIALAVVAFTPLANLWFETVSGLEPELAALALTPTRIAVLLPALSVLLSLQRAILVQGRTTPPITTATILEVVGIAILFPLFGWGLAFTGVTAAVAAFLGGRIASVAYLVPSTLGTIRRLRA
jgi:progressive ankylosis protein